MFQIIYNMWDAYEVIDWDLQNMQGFQLILLDRHPQMINKKLKSYLEYKLVHPRPAPDNQALLKLKALQKSRQKSRQKTMSTQKSHKNSQSFTETTHSTLPKPKNLQKQKQKGKDNFSSINSQIKQLQCKVDILLAQKNPDQFVSLSRRNQQQKTSNSRQPRQNSTEKKYSTTNSSLMKNQRLRNSFLSTYNTHQTESRLYESPPSNYNPQQPPSTYRTMIILKMQACKLLTNLNIEPQRVNYFEKAETQEDIFAMLQNTLAVEVAQRVLEGQHRGRGEREEEVRGLEIENQRYRERFGHLENMVQSLREEKSLIQSKQTQLILQLQQKQTQIYHQKMLAEQSQNQLLHSQFQHNTLCIQQKQNLRLDYEKRLYQQLNNFHQHEQLHTRLRGLFNEEMEKNKELDMEKKILAEEVGKWERECVRLRERYELERMQRKGVEEEIGLEVEVYNEYKQVMKEGYFTLVQKLTQQLTTLRQAQISQSQQITTLQKQNLQASHKLQQYQNDYLSLNDDFTRDVRQWVIKQEYFEKEIKQLREQLVEAHESIRQYSGMLAGEIGKAGKKGVTEHIL